MSRHGSLGLSLSQPGATARALTTAHATLPSAATGRHYTQPFTPFVLMAEERLLDANANNSFTF